MTYDDVMRLIEYSSPADWVKVTLHGEQHWSYRNDVMIHLQDTSEREYGDAGKPTIDDAWVKQVADAPARRALFTIFYGRSLLRNVPLVSVDGGRALLPLPKSTTELTVAAWDYHFARLVELLPGDAEYGLDAMMRKAGMRVE